MRVRTFLLSAAAASVLAAPALAATGYEVVVDDPIDVAMGTVPVAAHVTGGVGEARYAAYHVGDDWVEAEAVPMQPAGGGRFRASERPWVTPALPNGDYRLEVRVWDDVPPYRPDEPRTFARQALVVSVDNPPPAPRGMEASASGRAILLSWDAVRTSNREDFAGYRVLWGTACSAEDLAEAGGTARTSFMLRDLAAGEYCVAVLAVRTSTVSGTIASPASRTVSVIVGNPASSGGAPSEVDLTSPSGREAVPPAPPELGEGTTTDVSDGPYQEDLPYGPRRYRQGVDGRGLGPRETRPLGEDPRRTVTLVAAGLVLSAGGLLLRRSLSVRGAP
jgi:hypothetical protein